MWIGWTLVAGASIMGEFHFIKGNTEGASKHIIGVLIGAIIMAAYRAIASEFVS